MRRAAFALETADLASQASVPAGDDLTACAECGWDFHPGKLTRRRARGFDVCLSCAADLSLDLDLEDSNDLVEDYWSKRVDA